MIARLNPREKMLLGAIGAALAVLVSVFLIRFFLANKAELQKTLAVTRAKVETLRKRESERTLWSQREAWLHEKLPVLGDPEVANKTLREFILELAKKHTVTIEAPAPGVPLSQPNYVSLPIRIEAKGTWDAMVNFLYDLQAPDRFIAIENCDLKVNKEDKDHHKATLTAAQWFAPKSK